MSLKSYQRVLLYLVLVLFLTSLLSPWVIAFWDFVISSRPDWQDARYPFSRIFNRLFMIIAITLFVPCYRLLAIGSAAQMGLPSFRQGRRDLFTGFSLALSSFVVIVLAMSLCGVFRPELRLPFAEGLERSLKGLMTAGAVGLLEEVFFRGIIFKGLLQDFKPGPAFFATNLFYAAIHFVKPAQKHYPAGLDPWLGFSHLFHTFDRFLDPVALLPGLFGLFLLGWVLTYAFHRTGSLYLSIGLHAGWVLGIKTIKVFGNYRREDLGWVFGDSDPKFVSGLAIWAAIAAVGGIVHWLTRNRH